MRKSTVSTATGGGMNGMDQNPSPAQLRLLGGFELQSARNGGSIALGRKVRALLTVLAVSPGTVWPRERLMALLWSDRGDEQARASLRQALAELRRAFGEPPALRAEHDAISLDPAALWVDVATFERLAREKRWEEAATLYRGPLLDAHGVRDDAFEDWIRIERGRLHDLAMNALDQVAASQSGDAAIATVKWQLQLDPTREISHRLMMSLYASAGQRTQALRQYEHCRDILRRELQAVPETETEVLHRRIQSETISVSERRPIAPTSSLVVPTQGKPSIVVLPFTNLSGDAEQEYFSDGITDDIKTELSRFHAISVAAGLLTARFKGRDRDIRQIAAHLGVTYLVEGSVRRSGTRVRVAAQLIDADTGNHVWAERYDRELADVFDLQDEVARTIVIAVAGRVSAAGAARARRKPTESLSAYDNFLRARDCFRSYNSIAEAEPHLLKAVSLDPDFALAHALLSMVEVIKYQDDGDTTRLRHAEALGRRALELESEEAWCQVAVAHPLMFQNRLEEAGSYLERAVALNPNDTWVGTFHAIWLNYSGRTDEALSAMASIIRRDPMPLDWYWDVLAIAQTTAGLYAEAIASYNRMVEMPEWAHAYLAICYVNLGQLAEARASAAKFASTGALGNVADFVRMEPFLDPSVPARFRASLAAAGLPEG